MLIILSVLVAALLIAVVILWTRLRSQGQARDASASVDVGTLPLARRAPPVDMPQAASSAEELDPDATKVHIRPPLAAVDAVLRQRDGGTQVTSTRAHLVGLSGRHKGLSYAVVAAGITVGRNAACDIVIVDGRVSARHAWIGIVDGKSVLRDLKSTNGTFLNAHTNESVSEAELVSGDTIFFGGHQGDQFRFMVD